MKPVLDRHGIPDVIISDNGRQYLSQEFQQFAEEYEFTHVPSSPYHPQGNGDVERVVKTVKKLLRDTSDHNLALLTYQSTPLSWCQHSPAALLMGRKICSTLPISTKSLMPKWPDLNEFCKVDQQFEQKQKKNYDRWHHTSELPTFEEDEPVFMTNDRDSVPVPGRIACSSYWK